MTRKQTPLWLVKTRCAAVGAAVAVTFGLGGLDFASATIATGGRNVFVPVVPCRLFDTRPAPSTVGGRSTPILKDEQFEVSVRGSQGNCHVSAGATAVVLNVTAADAKGDGFLTVWPAENPLPIASNLNFSDGQAPAATAVTVKIDSQGAIKFASSARSLNVIADVVGYFEDHNHADAYKPKSTVLGTTVVPTTVPPTTLPPTTLPPTTTTVAAPVYDVPNTGNTISNGTYLRAFLANTTKSIVTIAPTGFYIGDQPLSIPPGVTLSGTISIATGESSYIRGESPLALSRPIVKLAANSTLANVGVAGTTGGAGVQVDTNPGVTAYISNVSINVSQELGANGAVYNAGPGIVRMTTVRTRSHYGVNNSSGSIVILDSDIDGVVQNDAGGDISVRDSKIGFQTLWPESGVTAYKTGLIKLTNVTVYSASVGVSAVDLLSKVDVQGGSILSLYPRKLPNPLTPGDEAGTTACTNVAKPAGGFFSSNCT
jgi:hypothetical protein